MNLVCTNPNCLKYFSLLLELVAQYLNGCGSTDHSRKKSLHVFLGGLMQFTCMAALNIEMPLRKRDLLTSDSTILDSSHLCRAWYLISVNKAMTQNNRQLITKTSSRRGISCVGWVEARNPTLTIRGIQKKLVFVTLPNLMELAVKQCNIADQKHRGQPSFLRS